jgi:hypothetical protein
VITAQAGEGVGVCDLCSSLACERDGARLPGSSVFRCGLCYPQALIIAAGLPPPPPPPPAGGVGAGAWQPFGADDADQRVEFENAAEFDALGGAVAEESFEDRAIWRRQVRGVVAELLGEAEEGGRAKVTRATLQGELGQASARDALQLTLLADAFGVAAWAIGLQGGVVPEPGRLALLPDVRIRYVLERYPYGRPDPHGHGVAAR